MSKPKYLRHDLSKDTIVVRIEELTKYIYNITNNEKQFPKAYRYTLTAQLRNTCLDLNKAVYNAVEITPKHRKRMKDKVRFMNLVYEKILDLKALIIVAMDVANISNKAHVATLFTELIDSYLTWYKNINRRYRHLPSKKEYNRKNKEFYESRVRIKQEWLAMDHDSDGFVILKKSKTDK